MVHISLSSSKGNQGLRYFPYTGYLGLTPVRVEGVVRTRLDDDAKQLQAKSITISVRCYESRLGRVSILHSNILVDYTQVLWSKPDGVDFAPIDNLEFPFRISIPTKVAGFSTAVFVDYRCMWRVEAVLNHAPISGIGTRQIKHFELPLVRYDLPPDQPTPHASEPLLLHQTTKLRAPRIRYCINSTTSPIGPLDLVSIPIHLLPLDPGLTVRSASVVVERRIQLNETIGPPPPPQTPVLLKSPSPWVYSSSQLSSPSSSCQELSPITSISSTISTDPTITPHSIYPSTALLTMESRPAPSTPHLPASIPPSHIPCKLISNTVAGAESSGQFSRDDQGMWSKTLTLQWPAAKSHSRWSIGETIQSELVSVKFFVRVKIVVSSPSGTESIELADKELLIVSTNEAERQLAASKYSELLYSLQVSDKGGRSKLKSSRRTRRDRDGEIPPSPAPPPPPPPSRKATSKFSGGSSSTGSVSGSANGLGVSAVAKPRRPHTSAGPRDKAFDFAGARMESAYGRERDPRVRGDDEGGSGGDDLDFYRQKRADVRSGGVAARPDTSQGAAKRRSGMVGKGYSFFSSSPRIGVAPSGSSTSTSESMNGSEDTGRSTSSSLSSNGSQNGEGEDRMREWEEELAKIEMRSRRSSDMLGFAGKRKRSAGAAPCFSPVSGDANT